MHRLAQLLSIVCLLVAGINAHALPAGFSHRPETMDPEELKPGMKGYGLTVFAGTEPERFDIEIKGVVQGYMGGEDMIIILADHPALKGHGAVAGMSGSPIFVDDKLIGALAYGWGFSVEPICGVTPIRKMLDVYDLVEEESPIPGRELDSGSLANWPEARAALDASRERASTRPFTLTETQTAGLGITMPDGDSSAITLQPLATPLFVSSHSPLVMAQVEKLFAGSNVRPVMAGLQGGIGGSSVVAEPGEIKGGSAFSVLFADGDLQLAGLGTATYVDGDRMVGFGHPMFGIGPVDAPIFLSEVVTIVPSLMQPFKLGNAVAPAGALRQDRSWAVGGHFGGKADMLPMRVHFRAPESAVDRTANFRLWRQREFLPQIAFICLLDTVETSARLSGPMTLRVVYTFTLADGRIIRQSEFLAGEGMAPMFAGMQMSMMLEAILSNRFEPVSIASIDVDATLEPQTRMMVLDRVQRPSPQVRRGDVYTAEVEYTQWRREPERIGISVPIPANLRPGMYEIHVLDGSARLGLEMMLHPELQQVESVDDIVELFKPDYPQNVLHVVLLDTVDNLIVEGESHPAIPGSIAQTIQATNRGRQRVGQSKGRLLSEQQFAFDSMVVGTIILTIEVTAE